MKFVAALFCWLVFVNASGQTIEGKVTDGANSTALEGATIRINSLERGAVTDRNGSFIINEISIGRYQLEVQYLGYESVIEENVWVKNGKVTFVEIVLRENTHELQGVEVSAASSLKTLDAISITEERINRIAATYYDPARLVVGHPGMAVANDQNNQISVRGLSPSLNIWKIEGVEIVNPNHLSNAGTFNDQPAATGGGVNVLSAQMLDKSSFQYGYLGGGNANSVAGIFDMNLRTGYQKDHQFTAQAGFIGFDFSAEGPLSAQHKSSYLVNYRYSFTGLLGAMGVDFNGETIGFQDLAFNVNVPLKKGGAIKFFGFGGTNENDFKAFNFEDSEIEKHRSDILFKGKVGALGYHLSQPLKNNLSLSLVSVISANENERNRTFYDDLQRPANVLNNSNADVLFANKIYLMKYFQKSTVQLGTQVNHYSSRYKYRRDSSQIEVLPIDKILIAPYADFEWHITNQIEVSSSMIFNHLRNEQTSVNRVDFRSKIKFHAGKWTIEGTAGRYSQLYQFGTNYIDFLSQTTDIEYLGLMSSSKYGLLAQYAIGESSLLMEAFYHYFPKVNENKWASYSDRRAATMNGETKGVSLSWAKQNDFFYLNAGGTWFQSTYNDGVDAPFNIGQAYNFMVGKNWRFPTRKRALSVNLKGIYQGGQYTTQIDPEFKERLTDYGRLDLRIQWIKTAKKTTRSWSLDIQNLTSKKNEAFQYYDTFTNQVETNYQLEMIPILTYRIEF